MSDDTLDHYTIGETGQRSVWRALVNGFRRRCPHCRKGHIFDGYLRVRDACEVCGTEFFHHRADDAPPYFTILITGHFIVPLMAVFLAVTDWPAGLHLMIWLPLTLFMILALLPRVKGALISLQWALRMHGFEHAAV